MLPNPTSGSGTGFNHPIRNLLTAAGLGLAINKSFNDGTSRVSEKVDLTMHCILVLSLKIPPPCNIRGSFPFMFIAVHAHRAPCDLLSSRFFFFTILSSSELGSELIPNNGTEEKQQLTRSTQYYSKKSTTDKNHSLVP
mmetsp:Transcript_20331/g.48866  ORF Transcript_20331/g.48866 Transcript_20331/m.48866 type:complete len:139 (-) Transcript_20331:525-941(-)